MQHDAGRVDDRPQLRPGLALQPLGGAGGDRLGVGSAVDGQTLGDMFTEFGEFGADGGDDAVVGVPCRQRVAALSAARTSWTAGRLRKRVFAHRSLARQPLEVVDHSSRRSGARRLPFGPPRCSPAGRRRASERRRDHAPAGLVDDGHFAGLDKRREVVLAVSAQAPLSTVFQPDDRSDLLRPGSAKAVRQAEKDIPVDILCILSTTTILPCAGRPCPARPSGPDIRPGAA